MERLPELQFSCVLTRVSVSGHPFPQSALSCPLQTSTRCCSPRCCSSTSWGGSALPGTQLSMENTNLLGYCAGLLVVTYNVPDTRTGREGALLVTILLDYLLGWGTPRRQPHHGCRDQLPPLRGRCCPTYPKTACSPKGPTWHHPVADHVMVVADQSDRLHRLHLQLAAGTFQRPKHHQVWRAHALAVKTRRSSACATRCRCAL